MERLHKFLAEVETDDDSDFDNGPEDGLEENFSEHESFCEAESEEDEDSEHEEANNSEWFSSKDGVQWKRTIFRGISFHWSALLFSIFAKVLLESEVSKSLINDLLGSAQFSLAIWPYWVIKIRACSGKVVGCECPLPPSAFPLATWPHWCQDLSLQWQSLASECPLPPSGETGCWQSEIQPPAFLWFILSHLSLCNAEKLIRQW
ncbi:hypothetical protein AVEN_200514-1 [Araneus ventricosus]|uniref:Uncharacterized protein n=1 Tax=Araneus ventricosus TaxID=182803 RepID=A0A4Y2MQI2_ARAVE|nr:hypothetical protein AVEN_200514-1 [Araneus ventricosus]